MVEGLTELNIKTFRVGSSLSLGKYFLGVVAAGLFLCGCAVTRVSKTPLTYNAEIFRVIPVDEQIMVVRYVGEEKRVDDLFDLILLRSAEAMLSKGFTYFDILPNSWKGIGNTAYYGTYNWLGGGIRTATEYDQTNIEFELVVRGHTKSSSMAPFSYEASSVADAVRKAYDIQPK